MAIERIVKIVVDTSDAESSIQALNDSIKEIEGTSATITIDTEQAKADIDSIKTDLEAIDNKSIKLDIDNTDAKAGVDQIEQTLNKMDEETIKVDLDTTAATASVRQLSTAGQDLSSTGGGGGFLSAILDIFQTDRLLKAGKNFKDLSKDIEKNEATIVSETKSFEKLNKEIEETDDSLEKLRADLAKAEGLQAKMAGTTNMFTEAMDKEIAELKELIALTEQLQEQQSKGTKLQEQVIDGTEEQTRELKKQQKVLEQSADTTEKASKGNKKFGASLKSIGTALKASIIGVLIAAFAALADALTKNQKAIDFFSTAWGAVSIAMEDLINYVTDNFMPTWERVRDFFANLTFESIGKAIKENLIERFESVIEVAGHLGQVFRKLFEGDFAGAWESAKDAGVEMVDVFTGVDDTVAKVTETVSNGIEAITEYAKEVYNLSEQQVIAIKNAEIAVAEQGKIIAQYTRQAELLRQIRDDESVSIYDRILANEELGEVLAKLQQESVELAQIQLRAAQITFDLNQNDANRIALIDAQTALIQANADAEGQASEQKVNTIALLKEEADIRLQLNDLQNQEALDRLNNYEEALNFDVARLQVRKLAIAEEIRIENERYQTLLDNDALSKEQQLIAEQEHQNNLNNLYADHAQNEIDIRDTTFEHEKYMQQRRVDLLTEFGAFLQLLGEDSKALAVAGIIASTIASIASIVIDTQKANAGALAKYAAVPGGAALSAAEITYNNISAGIGIATATVAGAKAISQLGGSGAPSGGSAAGSTQSPPQYNVIAENEYNPIEELVSNTARTASNTGGQSVTKAYVLSKDVTTAQEFDRAVANNSSL